MLSSPARRHALALVTTLPLALVSRPGAAQATQRAARAARLLVIGGALTELVYELGAQAHLIGVDSTSQFPPAATQLPNVGYARTLAAEGLLALAPSLIVATEDAGPPAVLRQVEQAGVSIQVLRADHRFEGLLDRSSRLGELLERSAAAQALNQRLQGQWQTGLAQVDRLRQGRKPLRVLFVLAHGMNQLRIAGEDTAADAMIRYAGGVNVLQGQHGYQTLTPEAAIAAAPDLVLATTQGLDAAGGAAGLWRLPGLAQTPAGRARRLAAFDSLELLGFGPRLPLALDKLSRSFYG